MTLYLFPHTIADNNSRLLAPVIGDSLLKVSGLIAESDRGGRSFLKLWNVPETHKFPLAIVGRKGSLTKRDIDFFLEPLKKGESWGFVSDAGLPCIADPGSDLVFHARCLGIKIQAFPGPCSITQALVLSGLPGQKFTFKGYFPKSTDERTKLIKTCVRQHAGETFIFIEAPYRNGYAFEALLQTLPLNALVCVASNLNSDQEIVETLSVKEWTSSGKHQCVLDKILKVPTIFLFHLGFKH